MADINFERIGARFREARKAKGMTQRFVAEHLDIETNSYSNLERGAQPINLKRIIELCILYGIKPGYLLDDCCPELLRIDTQLPDAASDDHRIIEPAPAVIEVLKKVQMQQIRWQAECGNAWYNPDGLVFTNEIGGHLCHFTVYKHFKKIVESIGLQDVRFHDMRHTFAVLSLETGADMKTVSSTMGHATVAFTMDKYGHVSNTMRRANAEKMQKYIEGLA